MFVIDYLRNWLQQFELRERRAIVMGAVIVLVAGLYLFVFEPVYVSHQVLQQRVAAKRELLGWMQQRSSLLRQSRPNLSLAASNDSLLANVDNAARAAGLGDAIRRVEQDGENRVRISLESAAFDNMVRWLGDLERNYGVKPVQARIDRTNSPGLVNATLTLSTPG